MTRTVSLVSLVVLLGTATACGDDDEAATSAVASTGAPIETAGTTVVGSLRPPSSTAPTTSAAPTTSTVPTTPAAPTSTSVVLSTAAPTTAAPTVPPSGAPTTPETTVLTSPSPNAAAAVTDLANRLGVDPATIVVADEREVTWPDSSLGCPQPGMQYLQRLTPGLLIVLEVNGQRHQYHAGGGRAPFLCTNPRPPVEGS